MTNLGVLNGDVASCATGLNTAGLICGWSEDGEGLRTAVYWDGSGIHSMGVIRGGLFSEAHDVNDNGIIVGTSDIGDEIHGFYYEDETMADLGTFPIGGDSRANAVSIIGEVVGEAILPSIEDLQAIVWNTGRVLKNINSLVPPFSDWDTLRTANDINDTAHVTGRGRLRNGQEHAFLLLPKLGLGNPIPGEAGTVNLFDATGATPNARIFLVYAIQWGDTPVPGCPGVFFGVRSPKLVGHTRADNTGHALYEIFVPNAASRRPILLQVVEDGSCDISSVLVWNFI
jgi:probable HAF family extracellular repeat protein